VGYAGMAQDLLNNLGVLALFEHEGCKGVPEVVGVSGFRQASCAHERLEVAPDQVVPAQRTASLRIPSTLLTGSGSASTSGNSVGAVPSWGGASTPMMTIPPTVLANAQQSLARDFVQGTPPLYSTLRPSGSRRVRVASGLSVPRKASAYLHLH
jgi:hypothetical protein